MPCVPSASTSKQQPQIATIENQQNSSANIPIPIVTCDFASDMSTSDANDPENQNGGGKETLKVSTIAITHPTTTTAVRSPSNGTATTNELAISPTPGRCRALSVGIDTDMVSEFDPSSSDSGIISRCAVVKPLKFKICKPIFGKKNHRRNEAKHQKPAIESTELEPALPKIQKPRDPEKEKRRIARKKEKRATLILGLIMGSFIACWLPFFFLYILTPACKKCKIPDAAFAVAFWLGYMNSALNPAIYTIFNKDFRRAFRRILFK